MKIVDSIVKPNDYREVPLFIPGTVPPNVIIHQNVISL